MQAISLRGIAALAAEVLSRTRAPKAGRIATGLGLVLLGAAVAGIVGGTARQNAFEAEREALSAAFEMRIAETAARADAAEARARLAQAQLAEAVAGMAEAKAAALRTSGSAEALRAALARAEARVASLSTDLAEAETGRAKLAQTLAGLSVAHDRAARDAADLGTTLGTLSAALSLTERDRAKAEAKARTLGERVAVLENGLALGEDRIARLLGRLEEAVLVSLGGLESHVRRTGLDADRLVAEIRATYDGAGGPFVSATSRGLIFEDDPQGARVTALMSELERVQLLRLAAAKLPTVLPLRDAFRFTSGFGARKDPRNRRSRIHDGIDLAGPKGTPIYATAEGEVVFAGRFQGYGNFVRVRHAFGLETAYAHLSRISVKVGERVAQGDRIGDMGNTGRSTGTHLHYEIRANGTPVDPMTYLKAAKDVLEEQDHRSDRSEG